MINDLITPDEIKNLRNSAVKITPEICEDIKHGKISQILPEAMHLKSGYMVQMTKDIVNNIIVEHISVSRQNNKTDPADAEHIANAILGTGWSTMPSMLNKNVLHFLKLIK